MKIKLRKLQFIAGIALKNGIRLHFDSVTMYENKSYPTALFLSIMALEEIGKAFWAEHYVWTAKTNDWPRADPDERFINNLLSDHRGKQYSFYRFLYTKKDWHKQLNFAFSKGLEKLKHDSIYVGLTKPKSGVHRTEGKIINPMTVKKEKAKKQIALLQGILIETSASTVNESTYFDLHSFYRTFDERLLEKLMAVEL